MDFSKTCRTCLQENEDDTMRSLFANDQALASMIRECSTTDITLEDGFPAHICTPCSNNLQQCHQFRLLCRTSYEKLKSVRESMRSEQDVRTALWASSPKRSSVDAKDGLSEKVTSSCRKFMNRELFEIQPNEKCSQTDEVSFFLCEMCDMKFVSEDALKIHRVLHQESGFKCRVCSNMFGRLTHLKRHIASAHPTVKGDQKHYEIVCNVCDRRFARTDNLQRHMLTHSGALKLEGYTENFECQECGIAFRNDEELVAHGKCPGLEKLEKRSSLRMRKTESLSVEHIGNNAGPDETPNSVDILENVVMVKNEQITESDNMAPEKLNEEVLDPSHNDHADPDLSVQSDEEEHLIFSDDSASSDQPSRPPTPIAVEPPPKRGRGRPRKSLVLLTQQPRAAAAVAAKRGRPRRYRSEDEADEDANDESASRPTPNAEIHPCPKCDKTFSRLNHLKRHLIIHSDVKPFVCEVCDKRFTRMDHLKSHRYHHSAVKPFVCEFCQRGFTRSHHLQKHRECRHSEKLPNGKPRIKSEFCTVCSKGFTTPKYLQVHMKMHAKSIACKFCSDTFATKDEMAEHMKVHAHEKPYLCSECGLRFVRNDYLLIHMRRHKGEKPYKCQYCGKGFPRATDLTVHERYHTGEKTHLCTTCGKGFQRAYNLVVHMRVHTGERPYKCPHCSKSFAQGNDLKAHVRRHTGERYKCDVCGDGFIQGYHLTQHKKKMHGIDVQSHIRRVQKFIKKQQPIREGSVELEQPADDAEQLLEEMVFKIDSIEEDEEEEDVDDEHETRARREMIQLEGNQTAIIEYQL